MPARGRQPATLAKLLARRRRDERSCRVAAATEATLNCFYPPTTPAPTPAPESADPRGEEHRAPVLPGAEPAESTRPETVSRGLVSMSACVLVPVPGPWSRSSLVRFWAALSVGGCGTSCCSFKRREGTRGHADVDAHGRDSLDNVHYWATRKITTNCGFLSSLESQCREFIPSFNVKVTFGAFLVKKKRHRSFFTSFFKCHFCVAFWTFIRLGSRILDFFVENKTVLLTILSDPSCFVLPEAFISMLTQKYEFMFKSRFFWLLRASTGARR